MSMNCPKCHGPLQYLHLPDKIDIESCPMCSGVFYDLDELTVDVKLSGLADTPYECPKCGGAMQTGTAFEGRLTLEQCGNCGGLWFDPGEILKLRKLTGREDVVGRRRPGVPDEPVPLAGPGIPPAGDAGGAPASREQIIAAFNAKVGVKPKPGGGAARRSQESIIEPPDCGTWSNPDIAASPVVTHDERKYLHFQTSKPVVGYVVGEFNWKVAVGDEALARDFVCPPFIISEDKTGSDTTWSLGEYIEPAEIWQGFKLEGEPPARAGTAPAQPNPHEEAFSSMQPVFWGVALACAGLFILAQLFCQNRVINNFPFRYDVTDVEKSRVTPPFDITGRTSNVRVVINTDLDNRWAFFSLALVNTQTDEAIDFGREISYYQGVEDGERWSEGSRYDTVFLPSVKAGSYYLRVEPETDASGISYAVELTRDVPRVSYLLYAWLLLGLPFAWVWFRRRSFEVSRWSESDHPWVKEDDDDDE